MNYFRSISSLIEVSILGLMSFALTACIHSDMPALKADIPTNWRHPVTQSASETVENKQAWWQALHDPVLDKLMQTALKQNLTLQQASERIIYARAIQKQELAAEKPQLNFYAGPNNLSRALATSSTDSNQHQAVSSGAFLAGFDLFWELPIFGQGAGQRQMTQADLQISQADLALKKISLTAEIVRVYAELTAAIQREQQLSITEAQYSDWKNLFAQGVGHGFIAAEETAALVEDIRTTQRMRRQNRIHQEVALQRLAVLCGQSEPENDWLQALNTRQNIASNTEKILTLPTTIPADIIRQRPDIKVAEFQVLKATGALGIAKSDLYPKLSIEGALMVAGRLTAETLSHTGSLKYIAPSIRIPLIDWGLRREVVNQRESQLREAILAYKEAVLLAIEETENAMVTFEESRAQLLEDEIEQSRRQTQLGKLQKGVEAGYFSQVDIFKQDIRNQQASLQYIDTRMAWMQGFAYANKALSGNVDSSNAQLK